MFNFHAVYRKHLYKEQSKRCLKFGDIKQERVTVIQVAQAQAISQTILGEKYERRN
jgi:hypothetical protein